MDENVKRLWVDALRSGQYKQGAGVLHNLTLKGEECFCCLGVLCDIFIKQTNKGEWREANGGVLSFVQYKGDEDETEVDDILPKEVANWAGMQDLTVRGATAVNVPIEFGDGDMEITELNDGFTDENGNHVQYDFNKLADLIEDQL